MNIWKQITKEDVKEVLELALSGGGDFADLYVEYKEATTLICEENRIENIITGVDQGAGIRIIDGDRTIYIQTNDLSLDGLQRAANDAALAGGGTGRVSVGELKESRPVKSQVKEDPNEVSIKDKTDLVLDTNKVCQEFSDKIVQVTVSYVDNKKNILIANSDGVFTKEERVLTRCMVNVVARDKDVIQTGFESIGGVQGFEIVRDNAEKIALTAAKRAVSMLEATPAPAGKMTIVMSSEAGGTMVHEACGHGLEADLVRRGMSVYADKLGEVVASKKITVIDDATKEGLYGYYAYDDEGTKAQKTVLIENGVLKNYMTDIFNSRKMDLPLTGNGRRQSYAHKPIPRMSTTYIAPGDDDPEKIIRSTKEGLYVTRMGGGQVNTTNGEFVFDVAEGFLIKDGKIGSPVRGATLIGNGPQVLKDIEAVGNDLGFSLGTCGKEGQGVPVADAQPTLKIKSITVGGLVEEGKK